MEFPYQLPFLLRGSLESSSISEEKGETARAETEMLAALKYLTEPRKLFEQQRQYIAAGVQALCAPTRWIHKAAFSFLGIKENVKESNIRLLKLTKKAAESNIPVGGCIGPVSFFLPPNQNSDFDFLYQLYREQIRALHSAGADFFLLEGHSSLRELRAALLAARPTGRPVFATLAADDTGRTSTGCTLLSALITLQAMGISALGLSQTSPGYMREPLLEAQRHACIPLIAQPDAAPEISPEDYAQSLLSLTRCGAGVIAGGRGAGIEHVRAAGRLLPSSPISFLPKPSDIPEEEQDCLAAAIEGEVFFLGDDIVFSEPLFCSSSLEDDLIDLEDEQVTAALIRVETMEDALLLAEQGKMARLPIAVQCDRLPILEAALRYFQGRLLIDSSSPLEEQETASLAAKYGAIVY